MRFLFACLVVAGSLVACDGDGDPEPTGGGGGGGNDAVSSTSSSSASNGGAGGGGCAVEAAPLHLVFTFPGGVVRDSATGSGSNISLTADVVGRLTLADEWYEVTDGTTGDLARFIVEGTDAPQLTDGQSVRLALRFRPAEVGGPDFYQVEVTDDDTGQLTFFAVHGGGGPPPDDIQVEASLGAQAVCTEAALGTGAGHEIRAAVVTFDGQPAVTIPMGASSVVQTQLAPLVVENQSSVHFVTPPETHQRLVVVGHVSP